MCKIRMKDCRIQKGIDINMKDRLLNCIKENKFFAVIWLLFSGYYLYRLFAIVPWYDEIYTYLNFIDKGVFYSATHWPLPNNHVFFSMISAFFRIFGIYIGLRGVSYLSALGTLLLFYGILKNLFSKPLALCGVMVYGMLLATNALAVQGRGYSLTTFFLALSLYCGWQICCKEDKKRYYIGFALSLYLGLYTLMSSLYWVLSVCVCLGVLLLLYNKYKRLLYLVLSAMAAAVLTLFSYAILWLHMGAWQLMGENAALSGSAWHVIMEYPRTCLMKGIGIMTADSNLQSIDRNAFVRDFRYFFRDTLGSFLGYRHNSMLIVFTVILAVVLFAGICRIVSCKRHSLLQEERGLLAYVLPGLGFPVIYFILLVQSVYPFTRVFSFAGIYLAVLICLLLQLLYRVLQRLFRKITIADKYKNLLPVPVLLLCLFCMTDAAHNEGYSVRDDAAYDAIRNIDWSGVENYLAGDIYAKQQVEFFCVQGDGQELSSSLTEPEVVILYKTDTLGGWPYLVTDEQVQALRLEYWTLVYENDLYQVYR